MDARTYWLRALALWMILMLAETLHGLWRVKVLAFWIGDGAAREVSVFTGSLVILLITFAFIGWISARSAPTLLIVGATWVALTVVYEFVLGRVVFHQTWAKTNEKALAQTLLGKIMLLHLHPANLTLQLAGFVVLFYGIWIHSIVYLMLAASLVFLGHMWGWHKVNRAL